MPQLNYPFAMEVAQVGQLDSSLPFEAISLINNSGRVAQVDTVVVDTATNSHVYTFTIDGVTISYTADGSTSTAEVSAGLVAAVNAENLVNGRVIAADLTGSFTLTARNAGVGFTTADVDAKCTLTNTTANATSSTLAFGVAVVDDGTTSEKCKIASAANMTAKIVNLTPANVNSAVYFVNIKVAGVTYVGQYTADGSATVQEIVEGLKAVLNGLLPASTVDVTEDDAKLILTAEVAGLDFEVEVGSSAATATWTVSETSARRLTDFNKAIRGISMAVRNQEMSTTNTLVYAANSVVNVLKKGRIWVPTAAAIDSSKDVYMGHTSTAIGKFTGAATSNYVRLSSDKFRWIKANGAGMGLLEVNL